MNTSPHTPPAPVDLQALVPLILEEWPQLDGAALHESGGDVETLVTIIAEGAEHTRALSRQKLAELQAIAAKGNQRSFGVPEIDAAIERLEHHTKRLVDQVQTGVLPAVETRARENLGRSLLTALGIGFILGLLFGGFGRGRS